MKPNFFLLLITFPALLSAQVTVKGVVTEQNSGNRPIAGVQIKALGSAPEVTGNDGLFRLMFTGKKPGDRIIVSEISKPGFEIVNKDVVNSWLVPGDPELRTRIVMCPEGLIAENTLKYYNISLAGLTKAYEARVASLKQQVDQAQIDRKTYMEQTRNLEEQYEKQQTQLEELADRFARENFDDCDAIHQQAFEAFKLGDIGEAIRILESVNSKEEIAKALEQRERGRVVEAEGRDMQAQSDSIIKKNIKKLMFQGDLYVSEFRFEEAEEAYETAVKADTSIFANIKTWVQYLHERRKYSKSIPWCNTALLVAKTESERYDALFLTGYTFTHLQNVEAAEFYFIEALKLYEADRSENLVSIPDMERRKVLTNLAHVQISLGKYSEARVNISEALEIANAYSASYPGKADFEIAFTCYQMGNVLRQLKEFEESLNYLKEAIKKWQALIISFPGKFDSYYSQTLLQMSMLCIEQKDYLKALEYARESISIANDGISASPTPTNYYWFASGLKQLAKAQAFMNQFDEAEQSYTEALTIMKGQVETGMDSNYDIADILFLLSRLEQRTGRYSEAIIHLEEAIRLFDHIDPRSVERNLPVLLLDAARVYTALDQDENALRYLADLFELRKDLAITNPEYHYPRLANNLSEAGWILHTRKLPISISWTEEAMQIYQQISDSVQDYHDDLATASARMARYYLLSKRADEAEKYARMQIAYEGNIKTSYRYLAHCLLYQGKYEEAEKLYTELGQEVVPWSKPKTFSTLFLEDFVAFEKAGVTHPDVEKIRMKLGAN